MTQYKQEVDVVDWRGRTHDVLWDTRRETYWCIIGNTAWYCTPQSHGFAITSRW